MAVSCWPEKSKEWEVTKTRRQGDKEQGGTLIFANLRSSQSAKISAD